MHGDLDKSKQDFKCDKCPFTTHLKDYLYHHKIMNKCIRFDEKTGEYIGYKCKICGENFDSSQYAENNYLKHYRTVHNEIPPEFENREKFLCEHCPEIFFNKYECNRHRKGHTQSGCLTKNFEFPCCLFRYKIQFLKELRIKFS